MIMVKVIFAIDGVTAGMIFLDVWEMGHFAVCLWLSCDGIVNWGSFVLHKNELSSKMNEQRE